MGKKIVIKIGSGVLLTNKQQIDHGHLEHVADQVVTLRKKGYAVVLVVSGAVALGSQIISTSSKKSHHRQAAAGIGQIQLMSVFASLFNKHDIQIAQVLVTKEHLTTEQEKVRNLLEYYLAEEVVPILNENDVLDLNSFGGNDLLAGEIAELLNTEEMIMLSTMKGSLHGVGGGETKVAVQRLLGEKNIATRIMDGKERGVLLTL